MNSLADYPLEFEDMPLNTRKQSGGKDSKMSKQSTTSEPKSLKKYNKTRGEHFKDIVIAVLITAITAFVLGMQFENGQNAAVDHAVTEATAQAQAPVKK